MDADELNGYPIPSRIIFAGCVSLILTTAHIGSPVRAAGQASPERWGLTEEIRIEGTAPGAAALNSTRHLTVGPNGWVFVTQPREVVIRVFDAAGRFRALLGGRGQGPHEFQRLDNLIGWIQDTLWVIDVDLRRVSFWGPTGRQYITKRLPEVPVSANLMSFVALLRDDGALMAGQTASVQNLGREGQAEEAHAYLWIASREGHNPRELVRFPIDPQILRVPFPFPPGERTERVVLNPLADTPLTKVSPRSDQVVILERARPVSDRGSFTLRRISSGGREISRFTYHFHARPVSAAALDSMALAITQSLLEPARFRGIDADAMRADVRNAFGNVAWYPIADQMVLGDDGTIWLRSADQPLRWLVIDEVDRVAAEVYLTPNETLAYAGRDFIWTIVTSDTGVPDVVKYRLQPPR